MNARSSRSHTIFIIKLESISIMQKKIRSNLYLVDLAGCERQKDTHSTGIRLDEAKKINLSLANLGKVINGLSKSQMNMDKQDKIKKEHIGYRNSKLTMILKNCLCGNSKTMIICTCSMKASYGEETLSTINFAVRVKNIKTKPKINA